MKKKESIDCITSKLYTIFSFYNNLTSCDEKVKKERDEIVQARILLHGEKRCAVGSPLRALCRRGMEPASLRAEGELARAGNSSADSFQKHFSSPSFFLSPLIRLIPRTRRTSTSVETCLKRNFLLQFVLKNIQRGTEPRGVLD